jgi:hypothetical protein
MFTTNKTVKLKSAMTRLALFSLAGITLSTALLPISVEALASAPATTNKDASVQASEVANALAKTDGVLGSSDQTKTTSDSDSAIKAATAGASVDIPKDASDGVTIGSTDGTTPAIDISLPNANKAKDAVTVAPGTVAYAGNNGSANAVQATEDGGVRMLTVIDNPNAPTAYDYKVTVPNGGSIQLLEDGSAVILDGQGQPIMAVATPWAKDANGTPIKTYFTTDGQTLTQHIEHRAAGVVYPVSADPFWMAPWAIRALIRCGVGGYIGWIGSGGYRWYQRALAIGGSCFLAQVK